MSKELFTRLQKDMAVIGTYGGLPDGAWGPLSHNAFVAARLKASKMPICTTDSKFTPELFRYCKALAWSKKVSIDFVEKVVDISSRLGLPDPSYMMACMAFETGETFSPTIKNGAGAPYYGLIQFGKDAATDAGTSIESLLKMSAEQQVEYVYRFFKPYTGKLKTLSDVYMRILYPKAVGKPEDYVLFIEGEGKAYVQNKGLDINKDGHITKAECAVKVTEKLVKGLNPLNIRGE